MASWGVLIGLAGFAYDGPRGHLKFAPRLTPATFESAFTAAEDWGTFEQTVDSGKLTLRIEPKWGVVRAREVVAELPAGKKLGQVSVKLADSAVVTVVQQEGNAVTIKFPQELTLDEAHALTCELPFA